MPTCLSLHCRRYSGECRVASYDHKVEGEIGERPLKKPTREDGETLAGYALIYAPVLMLIAFVVAVVVLNGQ